MNKKLQLALAASLLAAGIAQATMVTVNVADFATFTMDVDGDGTDDFTSLSNYGGTQLRVNSKFDFYLDSVMVPGRATAGQSKYNLNFPDADIAGEDIWSGTFEVTAAPTRWNNVSSAFLTLDVIGAHWVNGTKGAAGTDPVSLIGLVVDLRNYDLANNTGSVDLYTHYYGDFSLSDGAQSVSLADTGFQAIPEPSVLALAGVFGAGLVGVRRFFLI